MMSEADFERHLRARLAASVEAQVSNKRRKVDMLMMIEERTEEWEMKNECGSCEVK